MAREKQEESQSGLLFGWILHRDRDVRLLEQ